MRIVKIKVKNYRLLRDFSLELENDLSLIVGKNNSGKTSILSILNKLFNKNPNNILRWDDINSGHREEIFKIVKDVSENSESELKYKDIMGINLQIWIQYSDSDSYKNIQKFMMDLNPKNNFIILDFSYIVPASNIQSLIDLTSDFKDNFLSFELFESIMRKKINNFFELQIRSLGYDPEKDRETDEKSDIFTIKDINKIIKIRGISASREVSNKENNHSLSKISNRFYKLNNDENIDDKATTLFQNTVVEVDKNLTEVYNGNDNKKGIFSSVIERIKKFSGDENSTELVFQSSLSEQDLLSNNTTLYYKHEGSLLPETYNGLGYLNLYGIIFEIETLMTDIKQEPADINLVYIEEPESHTHPQLQYIFIKNIRNLINEHIKELDTGAITGCLQTLITTHSSHIVSYCDFDELIYFKRENNTVISKTFNSLKCEYNNDKLGYKFVKQYLTLNSSELFFADKVICIEGDTERILLPAMMQKVDELSPSEQNKMPLLSQNISIIETGAHSHVFRKLFDFLGIKVLIITDIDPAKKSENNKYISCAADDDATTTTNASIKNFFDIEGDGNFKDIRDKKFEEKISSNSCIRIAYQISELENNYQPASFEDAFISINKHFILENRKGLIKYRALKNFNKDDLNNFYTFARTKIEKKPAFASSLLYYGNDESVWQVPSYIKEGLLWLRDQ